MTGGDATFAPDPDSILKKGSELTQALLLRRDELRGQGAVSKSAVVKITFLILVGVLVTVARSAEPLLSKDDVTLLLIGGASTQKMVALIEQRGIDFQMNPDLAKKFHDQGADDSVIDALVKASGKVRSSPPPPARPENGPVATPAAPPPRTPAPTVNTATASAPEAPPAGISLVDPNPDQAQKIIHEFAAKEELFKEARNNYTYHQNNKLEEYGPEGEVVGVYQQDWDILYDDSGKRIERVTYAPVDSLKNIGVTKEDLDAMRNIQPFVLTTVELPDYELKYLGHVKVDEITAYVFSIRPKEIKKGRQYFQGVVWVDDRDLQIVKSEGKQVPELKTKGGENLFPRFTTYREQIDGKYWFPTFTMADDTLYFSTGPIHVKQIIRYSDYKQFKSRVRILSASPVDQPNATPTKPPPKP